jgi:hypothetical protein
MGVDSDQIKVNGEAVHPAATPFTFGECNVTFLDWGTPDSEMFLDPVPLADGMAFRGRVTKDRKFTMQLAVTGTGSGAKGQDMWGEVLALFSANNGLVDYQYIREDASGDPVDRRLQAIVIGEPAWKWRDGGNGPEDGLSIGGNIFITLQCQAPFPWWRDSEYSEETINLTGNTPAGVAVDRGGDLACGLEVKVTSAGTLGTIGLSDGNRSMSLTATFDGTPRGVDRFYTDPHARSVDPGVTAGIPASLSLHSDPTTITATPSGASGSHVVRLRWYPVWKTP